MAQIGEFTRVESGYSGSIRTINLNLDVVVIVPTGPADGDNTPDYRLHIDDENGLQIGVGWNRSSKKAGDYISILMDDPTFARPVHANLFQGGEGTTSWSLHWSRHRDRARKD